MLNKDIFIDSIISEKKILALHIYMKKRKAAYKVLNRSYVSFLKLLVDFF